MPVLLIILFAALDRLWGAAKPAFRGKKAVIAALAMGGGWLAGGPLGAAFGALFVAWRSLPFFTGSAAPQENEEVAACIVRHAALAGGALAIAQAFGRDLLETAGPFAVAAGAAVALALWYARQVRKAAERREPIGDQNVTVELLRGAAFGLAVAVALS